MVFAERERRCDAVEIDPAFRVSGLMARAIEMQDLAGGSFHDEDTDRHGVLLTNGTAFKAGSRHPPGWREWCCGIKQIPRLRLGMTHEG